MKESNNLKNSTLAYAFLLASSPALATGGKTGGAQPQNPDKESSPPPPPISAPNKGKTAPKPPVVPGQPKPKDTSPPKINFTNIEVDQAKKNKVEECEVPPNVRPHSPSPQHITSLAFDPDKKRVVTLQFIMNDVTTSDEHVLILLSSRCLTKKPSIKLNKPGHKLALDFKDIKQLGIFNLPIQPAKSPAGITFDVPLDTDKLVEQVKAGNETFYFQVGLLKKADFDTQHYSDMILSPLEAVHFSPKACPDKKQYKKQIRSANTSCGQLRSKSK